MPSYPLVGMLKFQTLKPYGKALIKKMRKRLNVDSEV